MSMNLPQPISPAEKAVSQIEQLTAAIAMSTSHDGQRE